jgi:hypothetical protein
LVGELHEGGAGFPAQALAFCSGRRRRRALIRPPPPWSPNRLPGRVRVRDARSRTAVCAAVRCGLRVGDWGDVVRPCGRGPMGRGGLGR